MASDLEVVSATGHKWNDGEVITEATCTEEGKKLLTCLNNNAHTMEETIAKVSHKFEDGVCENCPAVQEEKTATFTFGANGTASHSDGSDATSYTETVGDYTLTLSNMSKVYKGARDAKGNSALKLGTSSVAATFTFTVPDDVTEVIICVAKYKSNTSKILVNGKNYTLTKNSDAGEYDEISVDTTNTKTVSFETVSGGCRCMINTIKFITIQVCEHTGVTSETIAPTCTEAGYTLYTGTCGHSWTVADGEGATGHELTAVEGKEATCSENGIIAHYNCENCGKNYTDETATEEIANVVINKVDHTPAEAVQENVQNATCTEDGSYESVVYCYVCNEELSREAKTIEALDHNFVDGVCDREGCGVSQCTEHVREDGAYVHEGEEHYQICDNCSVEFNRGTCSWDEGKVTTESTCVTTGVMTYTCGTCNGTKTEEIATGEHNYVDGKCSVCDEKDPSAPTTVKMSSFSAVSGSVNGDSVVSYTTAKGGGTTNPAINSGVIRLYQNSAGTGGGTITINAKDGYKIQSVVIGSSMNTSIAYTEGTSSTKSAKSDLAANGKYTYTSAEGSTINSVTFYCMGTTSSTRLYVNYLEVTYVKA